MMPIFATQHGRYQDDTRLWMSPETSSSHSILDWK